MSASEYKELYDKYKGTTETITQLRNLLQKVVFDAENLASTISPTREAYKEHDKLMDEIEGWNKQ